MKVLNAHTSDNWETVFVKLNGFMLQLPVFPLRARGNSSDAEPIAAFWGDPDNLNKLWFVVRIARDGNGALYLPYAFVDPNSESGSREISSMYDAELRLYDELSSEREARRLKSELEKLRIKCKKLSHR